MATIDRDIRAAADVNVPRRRLTAGQRRNSILEAAGKVFGEHGFEHASLDDVAAEAGISKALIYEHFRNKENLYCELLDRAAGDLLHRVVTAGSDGDILGAPRLEQATRAAFEFVREQPRAFQMLVRNVSEPAIARHQRGLAGKGVEALVDLMEQEPIERRANLQRHHLEQVARMIVGSWYALAEWWTDQPERDLDEILGTLMGFMWIGLGGLRDGRCWTPEADRPEGDGEVLKRSDSTG